MSAAQIPSFLPGFTAGLTAITLAELGDKTFFIAALLATRHPRRWVFLGSVLALAGMTLLSVGIGRVVFKILPEDLLKIIEVVLFAGFGLKLLWDAQQMPAGVENDEAADAEAIVRAADAKLQTSNAIAIVLEALTLVFVAEWGDRTQFTTIFLAAAPNLNAVGVTLGAILGHAITAAIAVVSGRMVAQHLSEKLLYRLSGALFLVFAAMALLQSLNLMR